MATERKSLWTLLILAVAVLGWTLAVELESGWAVMAGLATALVLSVLIWLWPRHQDSDEPPP